jgi:arsenate reductase-like glutaredoxin family protein
VSDLLGGASARTIFNFKSVAFKKSDMDESTLSDDDLAGLLVENPRYFKRPLVVIDGQLTAGTNAKKLGQELGFEVA